MTQWFGGQQTVKFHGLLNQGATCYLNSVLQVLFMTEDFKDRVKRHRRINAGTEHIDSELSDLFNDLEQYDTYTFKVTKKLKITNVYEQRDAAEHYEKILRLTSPEASQIFRGELINRNTCLKCRTQTESVAGFWHLPLALVDSYNQYSVVKGIEEFFRSSEIRGEDQMYCERCDEKCDAVLDCELKHHPEVLVLLLKRFEFDRWMRKVKINRVVDVPYTLHVPQNQVYELYASVEHYGELIYGHYISRIKSQDNGRWYIFDDSRVTEIKTTVPTEMERSQTAYLLFYQKQRDVDPLPGDISEGSTPEASEEVTCGTEDTQSTTGEEEHNTSVRAALKRATSVEHEKDDAGAEDIHLKKQKQEKLSDQADEVEQTLAETGQKNSQNDCDEMFQDRQDLGVSDSSLGQQTCDPEVEMKEESKEEMGISNEEKSEESSTKVDNSVEDGKMKEHNVPIVQSQGSNETENPKDKLELRAYPTQTFVEIKTDMKDETFAEHVNIEEEVQTVKRQQSVSLVSEEKVQQPELSSDLTSICKDKWDKDDPTQRPEDQSETGAHASAETRKQYETVKNDRDVQDLRADPDLSSVPENRNKSAECFMTMQTDMKDNHSLELKNERSEQKESRGLLWSNKEREQTEKTGLLQGHKTKSNDVEVLSVTRKGDTEILTLRIKQDNTQQNAKNEPYDQIRSASFTSGSHGNRGHDARNSPEDLTEGLQRLTLSSSTEIKEDKREKRVRNKDDGQEQGLEERNKTEIFYTRDYQKRLD